MKNFIAAFTKKRSLSAECNNWNGDQFHISKGFWENADTTLVSHCLAAGADVNALDENGRTRLHYAAQHNQNPEVISLLLEAGADMNVREDDGKTPLHKAASHRAA